MDQVTFKRRTMQLAVDVLKLVDKLPRTSAGFVIAKQIASCGTSIGANYRAACRARSDAEMIAKLHICLEEADELAYWLEVSKRTEYLSAKDTEFVCSEADEMVAMFVSSLKTLKGKPPRTGRN